MAWPTTRLFDFVVKSQIASSFLNEFQDKARLNEIETGKNTNRLTTDLVINLPILSAQVIDPSSSAGVSRHLNKIESAGNNTIQFGIDFESFTSGILSNPGGYQINRVLMYGTKSGTSTFALTIDAYTKTTGVADPQIASTTVTSSGPFVASLAGLSVGVDINKRYVVGFSTPSAEVTSIFGASVQIKRF